MVVIVEICLRRAKFLGFPENVWVYDDLLISQPRVQVRTSRRASVTAEVSRLPEGSGIREKNEKEPATFSVLGYLNSRSANFVSSFAESGSAQV